MIGLVPPPDRADSRDQTEPIRKKNKDEDGREKPECSLGQMRTDDSNQEFVQCLDEPFQEVLCPTRNLLHFSGRQLGKYDQTDSDHPTDQHGIRDWKIEGSCDLHWLRRQAVRLRFWRRRARFLRRSSLSGLRGCSCCQEWVSGQ